ncbi:MAG: carboxylating nicotinate-nucleotide diphosphorylase [Candidatus Zhuqueibacterota bacterium]
MITFSEFRKFIDKSLFEDYFIENLYKEINRLIDISLGEDLDKLGDVTTKATHVKNENCSARIIAKQNGIFSGGFVADMAFKVVDEALQVKIESQEGSHINKGDTAISLHGYAESILTAERTALNLLSRVSGISTMTNHYVSKLEGSNIKILDTRKTCPGWRYLDKYAVKLGGGFNHRIGLFDMMLIKDNHIAAAGGITKAVQSCQNYNKKHHLNMKIEVETVTLEDVKEALSVNVDRIMLDNMPLEMITQAVILINRKCEVEISGGVNAVNLLDYYHTGVDFISIGEITHSAHVFDFSLQIE